MSERKEGSRIFNMEPAQDDDVTPLTLSMVEFDGQSAYAIPIIERGTQIPVAKTIMRSTDMDNQTTIDCVVVQGEVADALKNHIIGHFVIQNIPALPAGQPDVAITLEIDYNGIFNIRAEERTTNTLCTVKVLKSGGLSQDDIDELFNKQLGGEP